MDQIPDYTFRPDRPVDTSRGKFIVRHRTIDDYANVLDLAISRGKGRTLPGSNGNASVKESDRWAGASPEDYRDMLQKGWPDALKGVEGLDGLVTDNLERFQLVRNVAGSFANVPAHLAGHPASMYEMRLDNSEKRGVTMVVDLCFNCGVNQRDVKAQAVQIMQLVAWLQAQQIEAAVYGVVTTHLGNNMYCYPLTIREHGQVLQPERIAALMHPCWLRRAWFAMLEYDAYKGCDDAKASTSFGYGRPGYSPADLLRQIFPDAYAVVLLPKPGDGDPKKAVVEALNLKLKRD